MLPRILTPVVDWVVAHRQFSVEFENHGFSNWVFIRTWKSTKFVQVAVAIIDRLYDDPSSELAILGEILCPMGSGVLITSLCGGSRTLVDCDNEYLGSGYTKTLVDYTFSVVQLLKRCLQKTASVVFRTLDPHSVTVGVFCVAGVGMRWIRLLHTRIRIKLLVVICISSVI